MKKPKINFFSKTVYGLSTIFFGILFTIFLIGSNVAPLSSNFINEFFNINPWQPIDTGEGVPFNYYKSDFVNEDGSLNHEKMRANSEQVALEVATEGSVLLKNEDNALPLKQESKVSFLGISSNNMASAFLIYSILKLLLWDALASLIRVSYCLFENPEWLTPP